MVNACGKAGRYRLSGLYCKVLWASIRGSCCLPTAGKIALGVVRVWRGLFGQRKKEHQGQVGSGREPHFAPEKRRVKKLAARGSALSRFPAESLASPGRGAPLPARQPPAAPAPTRGHQVAPSHRSGPGSGASPWGGRPPQGRSEAGVGGAMLLSEEAVEKCCVSEGRGRG